MFEYINQEKQLYKYLSNKYLDSVGIDDIVAFGLHGKLVTLYFVGFDYMLFVDEQDEIKVFSDGFSKKGTISSEQKYDRDYGRDTIAQHKLIIESNAATCAAKAMNWIKRFLV